jgi:hypothetical protein
MPPEVVGLIEEPHLLIAILLVGAFAGMAVERVLSDKRRRTWRERNRWRWKRSEGYNGPWTPKPYPIAPKPTDAADQ